MDTENLDRILIEIILDYRVVIFFLRKFCICSIF